MTKVEYAEMVRLMAEEIAKDVCIREELEADGTSYYCLTRPYSNESIGRKITHLREALLTLRGMVNETKL